MRYKVQSTTFMDWFMLLHSTCIKMQPLFAVIFVILMCITSALEENTVSANGAFVSRRNYSTIFVNNGGSWGTWAWADMCPERYYAIGFSIKVEEYRGPGDDTSVNGIRLFCSSNDSNDIVYTVESDTGELGDWTEIAWCPKQSILERFQLKVEQPQGAGDDTAANNIRFRCSNGAIIESVGGRFGDYGAWSENCNRGGICGIQTKQDPQGGFFYDNTSLNDVRFFCCE